MHGAAPTRYHFDIEAGATEQLINGLDDIDRTLKFEIDVDWRLR